MYSSYLRICSNISILASCPSLATPRHSSPPPIVELVLCLSWATLDLALYLSHALSCYISAQAHIPAGIHSCPSSVRSPLAMAAPSSLSHCPTRSPAKSSWTPKVILRLWPSELAFHHTRNEGRRRRKMTWTRDKHVLFSSRDDTSSLFPVVDNIILSRP